MKSLNLITPLILGISFALLLILGVSNCSKFSNYTPLADTVYIETIIPGDSIPYKVFREGPAVPQIIFRDTGSTLWRTLPIDTNAILNDYFSKIFYSDTIQKDSSFLAIINDTVSRNQIIHRQFFFQNLKETTIQTTVVQPKSPCRNVFYVGLGAGGNASSFDYTASALYTLPRKKMALSAMYGFNSKHYYLTTYFKF